MTQQNEEFHADSVDEQVVDFLQASNANALSSPGTHVVQHLKHVYDEDTDRLSYVWERLAEHIHEADFVTLSTQPAQVTSHEEMGISKMKQQRLSMRTVVVHRRLELLAACLIAALIVGSMLTIFTLLKHSYPRTPTSSRTHLQTTPVQTGNSVYITYNGNVYKLDTRTGRLVWQNSVPNISGNDPHLGEAVVANGMVFALGGNSYVNAIDANTGILRWYIPMGEQVAQNTPQVVGNTLYVTANQHVFALNPANGMLSHEYFINGQTNFFPNTEVDGNILYTSSYSELSAFRLSDGVRLWHTDVKNAPILRRPHLVGNVLYVSSSNQTQQNFVYAFSASSGTLLWQSDPLPGPVSNVTVAQNIVYAGLVTSSFYAFNAHNGHTLWSKPYKYYEGGESSADENAIQVDNGRVYFTFFGKDDTTIHGDPLIIACLDALTGKQLWTFSDPRRVPPNYLVKSHPFHDMIVQNGIVFAVADDGYIYALNASGAILWHTTLS